MTPNSSPVATAIINVKTSTRHSIPGPAVRLSAVEQQPQRGHRTPERQQQPGRTAQQCKQQALGQQLADEPTPRRSQ